MKSKIKKAKIFSVQKSKRWWIKDQIKWQTYSLNFATRYFVVGKKCLFTADLILKNWLWISIMRKWKRSQIFGIISVKGGYIIAVRSAVQFEFSSYPTDSGKYLAEFENITDVKGIINVDEGWWKNFSFFFFCWNRGFEA